MKRRFHVNYMWRLFIPVALLVWMMIIIIAVWQFRREKQYRADVINAQLDLINSQVVKNYETGADIRPFLTFLSKYYADNPLYDRISISVYKDNELVWNAGRVISVSYDDAYSPEKYGSPEEYETKYNNNKREGEFYCKVKISPDQRLAVYTLIPYDNDIDNALMPSVEMLIFIIGMAMVVTLLLFLSARYSSKNVSILRHFAERAATDPNFIPSQNYPHDELGDISRQIIHMYNERSKAVLKMKREHRVTLHAMDEKARMKRQLTNNINHELKTPIGVIKGYLDTIIENPDMSESSRNRFINKAREHVDRLVNLITDISAITRLEDGAGLINIERINFHDLVFNVANDFEVSKSLGTMEFNYNIPLKCEIMGNYSLLTGMLINLAKNSAAYSKGTECGIDFVSEDKVFYKFKFYDNGVGVGNEHIPFLFDRFYRIDSGRNRKSGGTGLGLAIVQSTILAHKGEIIAENRPGGGLQFIFTLPKAL